MYNRILDFIKRKNNQLDLVYEIYKRIDSSRKSSKVNLGQIQSMLNNQKSSINDISEVEFQVFSQWGDDGIIQYLISHLDISNKTFIEFGVENYIESNTRFLLINNNWKGYVLDGSSENIKYIKNDLDISWAYELHAECSFIDCDNINALIKKSGFDNEVGLLSVDIDGNDYWVWKAINCISPVIVIVEYNSIFGKNTQWTIPYDPNFIRKNKHSSGLYFGASLKAFVELGKEKGYNFIGCNSKGNNAYFIRNDKCGEFKTKTIDEGYVLSTFREANINGEWISGEDRIQQIKQMDIFDLIKGENIKIDPDEIHYE
jgi:hypothetical protein